MFSKPINPIQDTTPEEIKPLLTYNEYFKNNVILHKYKMPQLKDILKSCNIRLLGTKTELITKIENYFINCSAAEKIQRIFRGYMAKQSILLRGEGFTDITMCVNDSDFYSLEPLKEISPKYFFSFSSGKFTYGCNIISMVHLIKNKTMVKNPYNRENIELKTIQNMLNLYNLIKIIYGFPEDTPILNTTLILSIHININNQTNRTVSQTPFISLTDTNIDNEIILERQCKLRTMREKPFLTRVQELFMEIDLLGNYTDSVWFLQLERYDYLRMYRTLHDIWTFRGNLTRQTKKNICIVEDPFIEAQRERINFQDVPLEVIREICLKIFEHLVYCGRDDEYRKIGTLHALTALTMVSLPARNAFQWLYESLY